MLLNQYTNQTVEMLAYWQWYLGQVSPIDRYYSPSTGVRWLMRVLATFCQGNQEPLMVKDKVGRSPGELMVAGPCGVWCCFPQCSNTVGLATERASGLLKTVYWFVYGDDLNRAFSFACLLASIVSTTFIILSFNKIQNGDVLVPANLGPPRKLAVKTESSSS